MPIIHLQTAIRAPQQLCFDLSRSIDLHTLSTQKTKERAIAGVMTGLIGLHEFVTWEAKHFGLWMQLTSAITALEAPNFFVDEMTHGIFKSIYHKHEFKTAERKTIMTDHFHFESPLGILGNAFNRLILTSYLTHFLIKRNEIIKEYAEGELWKTIIPVSASSSYLIDK